MHERQQRRARQPPLGRQYLADTWDVKGAAELLSLGLSLGELGLSSPFDGGDMKTTKENL